MAAFRNNSKPNRNIIKNIPKSWSDFIHEPKASPIHTDFHLGITYPLLFRGNACFLGNITHNMATLLLFPQKAPMWYRGPFISLCINFIFPLNKILFGFSMSRERHNRIKPDVEQNIVVYSLTQRNARKSQRSCKPVCLHGWGLAQERMRFGLWAAEK